MFKSARWRNEKNKVKVVFKLQFHATKLTLVTSGALIVSIVPADTGKPTVKSEKAAVRDGSCFWENPVYETVKFNRDPKSGKFQERTYYFVIGTGSAKNGVIGEATIDFSSYAESNKMLLESLPLKTSKTEAVLHVSIRRIQEFSDQREVEEPENNKVSPNDNSLRSQLGNTDAYETSESNYVEDTPFNKTVTQLTELNGTRQASIGSDITISSSESGSGVETPWEPQIKNGNVEASTDDSSSTPRENFPRSHSGEASDDVIEKLKLEISALSRQAEMSELELQTLRKNIVKESKRGSDLSREVVCLKEERDSLKAEFEKQKTASKRVFFEGGDSREIVEELRQELNHAKEINANLQIQLQKTQESNTELILAIRDLDEMLEQKNRETPKNRDDETDNEDQNALEELVKDHSDAKEAYLLEQQILDLHSEIEIYMRDKDELEMQMEQLALDYEIIKQENHDISYKLEQSQIQEQLKLQYECSSTYNGHELEIQIENLENELKSRSKEREDSMVRISELKSHVQSLEEELENQSRGFEADLEALTQSKIEQELRAVKAEETLRNTRWKNANTAERLQVEFRRLSVQMTSTFEANEKLAATALAEASELRFQKRQIEEILEKTSEEREVEKELYEMRLHQLASQNVTMTNQIEQLENQKRNGEETQKVLSDEILMLKDEIETFTAKNTILLEKIEEKEILKSELDKMRVSVKEMELIVEQGNDEKLDLENRIVMAKNEADEACKELSQMRFVVEEKELIIENLQSELDSIQSRYIELKHLVESEKETLRKQVSQLKGDLKKRDDDLTTMEKKVKDAIGRGTGKLLPRASKEVSNLKEKIRYLEGEIKLKEASLEISSNTYLEKEKNLHNKIEELEGKLAVLNQISAQNCQNDVEKDGDLKELLNEMALLKERNGLMEEELKEMQRRYSEISLKFAEVEGERQKLVMKLRNLQNSKRST